MIKPLYIRTTLPVAYMKEDLQNFIDTAFGGKIINMKSVKGYSIEKNWNIPMFFPSSNI